MQIKENMGCIFFIMMMAMPSIMLVGSVIGMIILASGINKENK